MADFLAVDWFAELNELLSEAGPVPLPPGDATVRVVIEFLGGPTTKPHAMTFCLAHDGASVEPGDHLAADAIVRLEYDDAVALHAGKFDSATALRDGRVKVRGDINAIVPVLAWFQLAHPSAH